MQSFTSIIWLYLCLFLTTTTQKSHDFKETKETNLKNGQIGSNGKRYWKSKDDIDPDYIDSLKTKLGIKDSLTEDFYDYPFHYTETEVETFKVAETEIQVGKNDSNSEAAGTKGELETNSTTQEPWGNDTRTNSTCDSKCRLREEEKKYRLSKIKDEILRKIGFSASNMPNMTGKKIPRNPSLYRLIEQFEMQADSPYVFEEEYFDEDDYYVKVERAYSISQMLPVEFGEPIADTVYFEISESISSRKVQNATLWIYLLPHRGKPKQPIELFVYKLLPPKRKGDKLTKSPIRYKKVSSYGWHEFEVGHIVHHWINHPDLNCGLQIQVIDKRGKAVVVTPGNSSADDEGYVATLEMKTVDYHSRRVRRSYPMICTEEERIETCCRYPLTVDFVKFGWDWVIAPTGYVANYCTGECKYRHQDSNVLSWVVQQAPSIIDGGGPCCTPTKMAPLALLYFDHSHTVLYTYMQRMIVVRCGCA
ncbi:hypothetical protein CHS0354_019709 [Potamilus streckersoni]|uniref:TGF-beta family profile domain-containing protein n=1 Tax=Potamilus streckersoni TaxID=2493646 RepID=A0AAE0S9H7_9BIVA|nr:hypothetical protein CHS0354_019709 [Potamilus streckersoni]